MLDGVPGHFKVLADVLSFPEKPIRTVDTARVVPWSFRARRGGFRIMATPIGRMATNATRAGAAAMPSSPGLGDSVSENGGNQESVSSGYSSVVNRASSRRMTSGAVL